MKLKIGMNIVHKSHGIGVIKSIEEREFSPGNKQRFYVLEIQDNGAPKRVFAPFETAQDRLRAIITKKEVAEIYTLLSDPSFKLDTNEQTWSMRYREYMDLVSSGDIKSLAMVLKALFTLLKQKELSFGERKLLDQAKTLLVKELALAENKTEEEVEKKLFGFYTEGLLSCHEGVWVDEEKEANARLISAAPELLRELKSAVFYIESFGGDVTANFSSGGNLDAVKAVIAKAEGESNE